MTDVLILIGTESGTAEMVGECLIDEFVRLGIGAEMMEGADADGDDLASRDVVLVCTATHGMGELPSNIQSLADALEDGRPDFSAVRYGVIALGDQTYQETFCEGGKIMDKLFAGLGAKRVGERLEIDACTQPLPDEEAVKWAEEWVSLL